MRTIEISLSIANYWLSWPRISFYRTLPPKYVQPALKNRETWCMEQAPIENLLHMLNNNFSFVFWMAGDSKVPAQDTLLWNNIRSLGFYLTECVWTLCIKIFTNALHDVPTFQFLDIWANFLQAKRTLHYTKRSGTKLHNYFSIQKDSVSIVSANNWKEYFPVVKNNAPPWVPPQYLLSFS